MSESQAFRNLAIELLDDEHGINKQAFNTLADMLEDEGNEDIVDAVDNTDDRYYLSPYTANVLRQKV